ncbi:hypothetical protein [Nocardiopsis coralliicola]
MSESENRLVPLAAATVLTLTLSACQGSGEKEGPHPDAESSEEVSETEPSLGDPGILAASCPEVEPFSIDRELLPFTFTLFSHEDGSQIVSRRFSADLTGAEVPDFPGGRATEGSVELPECSASQSDNRKAASELPQTLIPEQELLLVEIEEDVGGTATPSVGVLDPEGNLSALTGGQDPGDFETPVEYTGAVYDSTRNRVLYREAGTDGNPDLFHAFDLETGETSEAFECPLHCGNHWIDQNSGLLGWSDPGQRGEKGLLMSPDGAIITERADHAGYWSADSPEAAAVYRGESGEDGVLDEASAYYIGAAKDTDGSAVGFVSDSELLFGGDELPVFDVRESEIADLYEEDRFTASEPVVASYTLVPESPRTNESPLITPERDEVVFLSTTDTGDRSWYRVPADGSEDPTEIGPVTLEDDQVHGVAVH